MPTFTVIVSGSERHEGEKGYTYCLHADTRADAERTALHHHFTVTTEGTDEDLIIADVLLGPPPENAWFAWNDLRTYTSITPELVQRMIETPHGVILASASGRFRPGNLTDLGNDHDHQRWRVAYTRAEAIAALTATWGVQQITAAAAHQEWTPRYERWRHGGWYVTNVRYPSGAVGCVSRNYPDRKWRIVCDTRPDAHDRHIYPSREAAARAEHQLALLSGLALDILDWHTGRHQAHHHDHHGDGPAGDPWQPSDGISVTIVGAVQAMLALFGLRLEFPRPRPTSPDDQPTDAEGAAA